MLLLHRFAPLGVREPSFAVERPKALPSLSPMALLVRGLLGTLVGLLTGVVLMAILTGLKGMKTSPAGAFSFAEPLREIILPVGVVGWMQLAGIAVFGMAVGLVTAALSAAQRGHGDLSVGKEAE
jgi:PAT family beta-lactamase induction signal transducer AmpG